LIRIRILIVSRVNVPVPKTVFVYIFTSFSLSVGPIGPTDKVFFVQFSLPVNFDVLMRVAYGSDPGHFGNGSGS
jgi:hypothetical protein